MPWQLSGQAAGLRLRSVRPARPTPPKELPGVPPRAGESVSVGTKTCRLIFLFTDFIPIGDLPPGVPVASTPGPIPSRWPNMRWR